MKKLMMAAVMTALLILTLGTVGCDKLQGPDDDNNGTDNGDIYVLCEGNFQSLNSTLWSFGSDLGEIEGPLHWDPNVNPLGDTGQSLFVHNDRLYVVVNNSHSLEIVDIAEDFTPIASLNLNNAAPRYFTAQGNTGYLTTWFGGGILVIDLEANSIIDTIATPGIMTEAILVHDGSLYASSSMKADWSNNNAVLRYSLADLSAPADTFTVIPGPVSMAELNGDIYVASQYYDAFWNSFSGTSVISTADGTVRTNDYGTSLGASRLVVYQGQVYRTIQRGIALLNSDLSIDNSSQLGDLPGVYSVGAGQENIFIGHTTDHQAPDTVTVLNGSGEILKQYQVGAVPGSFALRQ